jgi:hypothetical protein
LRRCRRGWERGTPFMGLQHQASKENVVRQDISMSRKKILFEYCVEVVDVVSFVGI